MLLPDSDLKLKVNDFVRMSSLVVPTFGELSLRHWFNCTPLSSLWSCYGAYMTGDQYTDLDSQTGTSVRRFMPMFSLNELFGILKTGLYNDTTKAPLYYGNLTYFLKNREVVTFDEWTNYYSSQSNVLSLNTFGFDTDSDTGLYPVNQENVKPATNYYRCRIPFDFPVLGWVMRNTDNFYALMKDKNGNSGFPSPSDCPYIVMYNPLRKTGTVSSSLPSSSVQITDIYFTPLTTRMFQGDSTAYLYKNGWIYKLTESGSDSKYHHYTGNSEGWYLHSDDSYFTGKLGEVFDFIAPAYASNAVSGSRFDYGVTLSRRFKRLRKLFVGLGYQFNPFDTQPQTPWKLMHYYKAWFDMFFPKRDTQYYQTPLSRVVNFMSYHGNFICPNIFDKIISLRRSNSVYEYKFEADFLDMLFACADAKYVLPIDYYTLADPEPQQTEGTRNENIKDNARVNVIGSLGAQNHGESDNTDSYSTFGDGVIVGSNNQSIGGRVAFTGGSSNEVSIDGLTIKLAEKLTKFLVKKRIVGKSISDRMRAMFGVVDPHDKS
ncbi:unnamed protein product, partial [Cylicocyclus nassatus]